MSEPVPDFSVVLPAYNEAGNIARMASTLDDVLKPLGRYEIIFVDDGSADGTLAAIRAAAIANPHIRYLSFTRNFGHQEALRAGLKHARGRAVIVMDADFEHPPELLPDLVAAWRAGSKVVATRREDGEADLPALKSVTSRLYYRLLDAIGDVSIEPGSSDYMLLDRSVVDTLNGFADQDVFLRGAVRWFGYPTTTITFSRGRTDLWREQIHAQADGRPRGHRHRRTQRAPIAARDLARARLCRGRPAAAGLFGGELCPGPADRDRLDLDHGDDRACSAPRNCWCSALSANMSAVRCARRAAARPTSSARPRRSSSRSARSSVSGGRRSDFASAVVIAS